MLSDQPIIVPSIIGVDANGDILAFDDLENKFIVLHFMDADCSQCKATLPDMQMVVQHAQADLDIELLSVGMGYSYSNWLSIIEEQMPSGTFVYFKGDKSPLVKELSLHSMPTIYILNKKREIKAGPLSHPDDLEDALHELLN